MRQQALAAATVGSFGILTLWVCGDARAADEVDFQTDVQPILAEHCLECHGADRPKAGLNLGLRDSSFGALKSGNIAVVSGDAAASVLIKRITHADPDKRMPKDRPALSPQQIQTLTWWIEQGAAWQAHWAYQPIERPVPPDVRDQRWPRNAIDRFVLAELERRGIEPSPEADRYTLIKRVHYDLVGLPPTPEEVDAYVKDTSVRAYEDLVERVLASPRFGERWGRHWLDKARYADSDGYEKDRPRPDAWRYRDWVINAINEDMPFDEFTVTQLAGDLLPAPPEATAEQKLATAFHRQTLTNEEGGVDKEQFRVEATFDRAETTGAVWLGLTVGCARCHSHKYDQITQHEYYGLYAFFNNADEAVTQVPISAEQWREFEQKNAVHLAKVRNAEQRLAAAKAKLAERADKLESQLREQLASTTDDMPAIALLEIVSANSKGRAKLKEQKNGSYLASGRQTANDVYTIAAKVPEQGLTGVRLEMLPHASLPKDGPGRSNGGNFVLSEIALHEKRGGEQVPVTLHSPTADFSQNGWNVAGTLDGKGDTGWAISPQMGKEHHATFRTVRPIHGDSEARLIITLDQRYKGGDHSIGHFRLLGLTGDHAGTVPAYVRSIVATPADQRDAKQREQLLDYLAELDAQTRGVMAEVAALKQRGPKPPVMDVRILEERDEVRPTHLLHRGDFLSPGEEVEPGTLAVLPPLKVREGTRPTRLDLARWLVSDENPLTPRVAVNHIWFNLFGEGLVPTGSDFGVRGEQPSHPALLDWLASELMRSGWSRKHVIRLIVNSATYRQASAHRPALAQIDPLNRLLARQNRVRVQGEIVRDLHLAASGLLTDQIGGPSVFPPMPADVAALSYANNFKWAESKGEDRYRRGMYTFFKRTAPHPDLMTFDCPDANVTMVERHTSNTPLQALTTLNADAFAEASRAMAKRLLMRDAADDAARLTYAFRLCMARPPGSEERSALLRLLSDARDYYRDHADEAKQLIGDYRVEHIADSETAAWIATARIIMNADEFITRE